MRFDTLDEWLRWQEQLAPRKIDLGLERVQRVWNRLGLELESLVITVAGTNGKGSTISLFESILHQGGYSTASYTSPHLIRYNERIRLRGEPVCDELIMQAFEAVDEARNHRPLTYFEFGTLAALSIMAWEQPDVALLEVGLGGRLDAVNIIDADLAVITSIDLDHQAWLGENRELIGREKAGILRSGRPAVFSALGMPRSIEEVAERLAVPLYRNGKDFRVEEEQDGWRWCGPRHCIDSLPAPALAGRHQLDNAAGVLMGLELLSGQLPLNERAMRAGLRQVALAGRIQTLVLDGVEWVLDVAHNPHGAAQLGQQLQSVPVPGRTHALLGMLEDKDVAGVMDSLRQVVDRWHYATLANERGLGAEQLCQYQPGSVHASVREGLEVLRCMARRGDRVVVFGSFHTVGEALPLLQGSEF